MLKHNESIITISNDDAFFDRLANSPFVLEKAEKAKAFLAKVDQFEKEKTLADKTAKKNGAKTGRNPRTGKEIKIRAKKVKKIIATTELPRKVNK
jgi:ATPase subunit of ABC transporter with duplicated ATPase domains